MARRILFDPSAQDEVDDAKSWYARRNPQAASRFVEYLRRAVSTLAEDPRRWAEIEPGVRRFVLPKFPYSIIYAIEPDCLMILAVAHHRRHPGYWRDRR